MNNIKKLSLITATSICAIATPITLSHVIEQKTQVSAATTNPVFDEIKALIQKMKDINTPEALKAAASFEVILKNYDYPIGSMRNDMIKYKLDVDQNSGEIPLADIKNAGESELTRLQTAAAHPQAAVAFCMDTAVLKWHNDFFTKEKLDAAKVTSHFSSEILNDLVKVQNKSDLINIIIKYLKNNPKYVALGNDLEKVKNDEAGILKSLTVIGANLIGDEPVIATFILQSLTQNAGGVKGWDTIRDDAKVDHNFTLPMDYKLTSPTCALTTPTVNTNTPVVNKNTQVLNTNTPAVVTQKRNTGQLHNNVSASNGVSQNTPIVATKSITPQSTSNNVYTPNAIDKNIASVNTSKPNAAVRAVSKATNFVVITIYSILASVSAFSIFKKFSK